jgi:hypothetical protein
MAKFFLSIGLLSAVLSVPITKAMTPQLVMDDEAEPQACEYPDSHKYDGCDPDTWNI